MTPLQRSNFWLPNYNKFVTFLSLAWPWPDRTATLIESASQIRRSGATGAYSHEFESLEDKIDEVRNILLTANATSEDLSTLEALIGQLTWGKLVIMFFKLLNSK